MTDDRTPNLNLALPHQDNLLLQDVVRLRSALTAIDSELHGILSKFGAANGLAQLDSSGKVPASQLPSYVDDVLEFASLAAFPGAGEQGKIYVALDTGEQYRWSGSAYIVISPSPGSTDDVPEGSVNRYFTDARARSAQMPATASTLGVVKIGSGLSVGLDGTLSALGGAGGTGVPAFNELVLTPSSNGQTVFAPAGGYDVGQIELYLNGVMLYGNGDDYTASDGVQIVLTAGVTTVDSLLLRRWTTADSLPFSAITDKPTTLAGYGVTEVPFSVITGKPTTISGYGITNGLTRFASGAPLPSSDIGPIWHDGYAAIMTWRTIGTYTGYASVNLGEVTAFDVQTPPTGWLHCAGQDLTAAYAALIQFRGSSTLLDMRGEFIRGWDGGRGIDAGRAFRSLQLSQNLSHNHTGSTGSAGSHRHFTQFGVAGATGGTNNFYTGGGTYIYTNYAGDHSHTVTIDANGGTEARPRNVAQLICIKF